MNSSTSWGLHYRPNLYATAYGLLILNVSQKDADAMYPSNSALGHVNKHDQGTSDAAVAYNVCPLPKYRLY